MAYFWFENLFSLVTLVSEGLHFISCSHSHMVQEKGAEDKKESSKRNQERKEGSNSFVSVPSPLSLKLEARSAVGKGEVSESGV